MKVFEQVAACIAKAKGISTEIQLHQRLREDLNMDSFDSLMIVCELEDTFNISIKPEELKDLSTVQDIVDSLEARIVPGQTSK